MSVVGRAYVTVRAVTRQVPDDIERGMDKALGNIDAKAKGGEFGAAFSEGAGSGIKDSDHIGDSLSQKIKDVDVDRDGRDVGTRLGQAIGDSLLAPGPIEKAWTRIHDRMSDDSEGGGRDIGSRFAKSIGEGAAGLATSPIFAIGTVALPLVQDALGLVSQAASGAIALSSTLGPVLAGSAAVGANAMVALGTTIGAVTLALKTQSDELDHFKASLLPVRDEFRGIGEDVQKVLLPALSEAATRTTAALGPTLRQGLVATGEAVGYVATQFAGLAEKTSFQRNLADVFEANAVAIRDFGDAGIDAADSFVAIGAAAGPLTTRFSSWASSVMEGVNATIQAKNETGELTAFFDRAGDTAAKWGDVLGNTASAIFGTFSAGSGEGQQLLGMLQDVTQRWDDWTKSIEGKTALADWFADASEVAHAFGGVLGGLGEGVRNWMGDTDDMIGVLEVLGSALPNVGDALHNLTGGARSLLEAILPATESLGDVAPKVEEVANSIAAQLAPAVKDIAPDLADMATAALEVVDAFTPAIGVLGDLAGIATTVLTPAFRGVATVLDALPNAVTGVLGAAVLLRVAFVKMAASSSIAMSTMAATTSAKLTSIRAQMALTSGVTSKMRVGMGASAAMLGGPFGIALGAAVIGLGVFQSSSADAKATTDQLTGTLDEQTGAFTENTRAALAKSLIDKDMVEQGEKMGLSINTQIDAILGQEDAINKVNAAMEEAGVTSDQTTGFVGGLARGLSKITPDSMLTANDRALKFKLGMDDLTGAAEDSVVAFDAVASATGKTGEMTGRAARTAELMRAGLVRLDLTTGQIVSTFNRADGATGTWGKGLGVLRGGAAQAASAQRALTRATIAYHKAASAAMRGTIGLEQSIDDAAAEMRKGARGFNINTQAGRDNKLALIGIADAAAQVTGSAKRQTDALEKGRNKIIELAQTQGKTKGQAEALADKLISVSDAAKDIPDKKETRITQPGMDKAQTDTEWYHTQLNNIPQDVFTTIHQSVVKSGPPLEKRAGGGWIIGPGTTTSDSIPYGNANVSNREFVVNAAAAARNAALLESINSGATVTAGKAGATAPVGGGGDVYYNYYISVINPRTERTSDSIPRSLRRARDLGIVGSN